MYGSSSISLRSGVTNHTRCPSIQATAQRTQPSLCPRSSRMERSFMSVFDRWYTTAQPRFWSSLQALKISKEHSWSPSYLRWSGFPWWTCRTKGSRSLSFCLMWVAPWSDNGCLYSWAERLCKDEQLMFLILDTNKDHGSVRRSRILARRVLASPPCSFWRQKRRSRRNMQTSSPHSSRLLVGRFLEFHRSPVPRAP